MKCSNYSDRYKSSGCISNFTFIMVITILFSVVSGIVRSHTPSRILKNLAHYNPNKLKMMKPPPFNRGESFEFGGGRESKNEGKGSPLDKGSGSEMVRLNPCYFDHRRGCLHSNSICPIDGRRCSADRSYLDGEYEVRRTFEDFSVENAIEDATTELSQDINNSVGKIDTDNLLYTYWGGDLSNSTDRDPDTPYGSGSHQELT